MLQTKLFPVDFEIEKKGSKADLVSHLKRELFRRKVSIDEQKLQLKAIVQANLQI